MAPGDSRFPHYRYERKALKNGAACVAGIDEAGRGPLAGPVVAAAVILDPKRLPKGVNVVIGIVASESLLDYPSGTTIFKGDTIRRLPIPE